MNRPLEPLEGKNVLVTGGSSGLGAAIVELLVERYARPIVIDRQATRADVRFEQVDLADTRRTESVVRTLANERGLDAVVTCAAMDKPCDFAELDGETWDRVVSVNLLGTAAVIRGALPALMQSRGRIITVASTLGLRALPAATAYCAGKFGVVGFTRALALELQGKVGVTLLVPGGMKTAFFDDRDERFKPSPSQMLNTASDVARCVLFALEQPANCEVRELLVTPSVEPSWP